jgi:hypothetical protein
VRPTIAFAHFPPTTLSRTLSTANAALGLRGLVVSSCTQITANDVIPGLCNRTAGFSFYDFMTLLNWKPNRHHRISFAFSAVCVDAVGMRGTGSLIDYAI